MGKLLLKTSIKREQGKLYYCGTSNDGFVTVNTADMARGRKKIKKNKK